MKKRGRLFLMFVIGGVVGVIATVLWQGWMEKNREKYESFSYGVESSTLLGTGVEWREFPQFRTVQLKLHGELVVSLPKGGVIAPEGLVDENALREISRKEKFIASQEELIEYDVVTYLFEQAEIKANINRIGKQYPEKDAECGYELSCVAENDTIVVGYIVPMTTRFYICSKEETKYFTYPQSLEFGLAELSRTYLDKENLSAVMEQQSGIRIERIGTGCDFILENDSSVKWDYSSSMPDIEVWNQGVWMRLQTFLDDPLTSAELAPGGKEEKYWNKAMEQGYPYKVPGIYRIVVYGEGDNKGSYSASESFVIER